MDRIDRISCVIWLAVSVFVCITSLRLGIGALHNPGPGFILFWASILLALFACILLGAGLLGENRAAPPVNLWKGLHWNKNIVVAAALICYCLILQRLGYLLATFGLMLALFSLGKMRPWALIFGSLVTALSSYCLFGYFLEVPLPRGILGF